jgi:hypothetical protein
MLQVPRWVTLVCDTASLLQLHLVSHWPNGRCWDTQECLTGFLQQLHAEEGGAHAVLAGCHPGANTLRLPSRVDVCLFFRAT